MTVFILALIGALIAGGIYWMSSRGSTAKQSGPGSSGNYDDKKPPGFKQ